MKFILSHQPSQAIAILAPATGTVDIDLFHSVEMLLPTFKDWGTLTSHVLDVIEDGNTYTIDPAEEEAIKQYYNLLATQPYEAGYAAYSTFHESGIKEVLVDPYAVTSEQSKQFMEGVLARAIEVGDLMQGDTMALKSLPFLLGNQAFRATINHTRTGFEVYLLATEGPRWVHGGELATFNTPGRFGNAVWEGANLDAVNFYPSYNE